MMQIGRHYPNAPITEALIDLRVTYPETISLQTLRNFGREIRNSYPNESPRELVTAEFNIEKGASTKKDTLGYIYHSGDKLQAVQARLDGFTFSRFKPYQDWEHLTAEAKRLWQVFIESTHATSVQRVAVRYINQLNLPREGPSLTFDEYLNTRPVVGANAPQAVQEFLLRLVLRQDDLSSLLVLTEALLPQQTTDKAGIILDIDLFRRNLQIPVDSEEIWSMLGMFRERKNLYFEASITDKTRELFK